MKGVNKGDKVVIRPDLVLDRDYSVVLLRAITKQCEELGWLDD